MLEVMDLSFCYKQRDIFNNISFSLEPGQLICLLGQNGAGKTTLFKCILKLLKPSAGRIMIDRQNTEGFNPRQMAARVAYIPQCHTSVFGYSAWDVVLMGTTAQLSPFSVPGGRQAASTAHAMELLDIIHLAKRPYRELSGGEQQMVLIARAIAQEAGILIMDEPCSNLDYGNQIDLMRTLKKLSSEGFLILLSIHNIDLAMMYADQLLVLHKGALAASGPPELVVTEELISNIYGLKAAIASPPECRLRFIVPEEFCSTAPNSYVSAPKED